MRGRWAGLVLTLLTAIGLMTAGPARAEWWQASTDHFILTIEDSADNARSFATKLERFDAALRLLYGVEDNADRRARPLHIYEFRRDLFDEVCHCPGILGYYNERPESSLIFSTHDPKSDRKGKPGSWSSLTVLLHEYGHHFTFSNFPIAYPYWFAEGFPEFNAASSFEEDGSIIIGYPANYRADPLKSGTVPSPKRFFDPQRYGFPDRPDILYARGWLLTNYLILNPARQGQLATYLGEMNKGQPSLSAAEHAFGDLEKLNAELEAYRKGTMFAPLRIPGGAAPLVKLRQMSAGEVAMLPVYSAILHGENSEYRKGVAMKASAVAARYPDDPIVQAQWAEAEVYAGRLDKADLAVDAALKLDPENIQALLRKSMIAVQRAKAANSKDPAVWSAARAGFLKANKRNPDAVMPLYLYHQSFVIAQAPPSASALRALERAAILAPESTDIRLALARQRIEDGDAPAARALLQPTAFAPHTARKTNKAREIVDLLDAGKLAEARATMIAFQAEREKE